MDSHVLRLIRRYDPVVSSSTGIKTRQSLEKTRGVWNTIGSDTHAPIQSNSSPILSRRALTTTIEDGTQIKSPSTTRLQRQEAIQEHDSTISIIKNTPRPILKYASPRSRAELQLNPHKTEPLNIEIEPFFASPPPLTTMIVSSENPLHYQSLITTGSRRVCSALSKSEWDLRLQRDSPPVVPPLPFPVRPPSPPLEMIQSPQGQEPSVLPANHSQSSLVTNNKANDDDDDDFDQMSAPIISTTGSYVKKLKKMLERKSSLDNIHSNSNELNLDRYLPASLIEPSPNRNSSVSTTFIEPPPRTVFNHQFNSRPSAFQEVNAASSPASSSSLIKKPIFRSQKTIDE